MSVNEEIATWWDREFFVEGKFIGWLHKNPAGVVLEAVIKNEPEKYDTDLAFWHGEDGLLTEIEKKGLIVEWVGYLQAELDPVCTDWDSVYAQWLLVGAPVAMLAGALVKAIKQRQHECVGV